MRPSYLTILTLCSWLFWQTGGFAQTPAVAPVAVSTPAATALLDGAIAVLTRPQGVDVRFVQTIHTRPLPATLTGRSVTADKQRVHVELNYQQVGRKATLKLLCDGITFYRLDILPGETKMQTYKIQDMRQTLDALATNEVERLARGDVEKELQGIHGFAGLSAMVIDLKKRMNFVGPVDAKLDLPGKPGASVKLIEGKWTKEVIDVIAPPKIGNDPNQKDLRFLWNDKLDFFQYPRTAKLYFDANSGQLYRLEMWGVLEKQAEEKVLTTLDLHSITPLTTLDPKLFQPTDVELQYKAVPVNLADIIRARHQETMEALKKQQAVSGNK